MRQTISRNKSWMCRWIIIFVLCSSALIEELDERAANGKRRSLDDLLNPEGREEEIHF